MSSDKRDLYIIPGRAGESGDESVWLAPEPAGEVIVGEIVSATDLDRADVEPLEEHVDFETLRALLTDGSGPEDLTFTVGDWSVTVDRDGAVEVTDRD